MKTPIAIILLLIVFFNVNAQQNTLPEFDNKPAYSNTKSNLLIELEKAPYNTMAKAKRLFKSAGGERSYLCI